MTKTIDFEQRDNPSMTIVTMNILWINQYLIVLERNSSFICEHYGKFVII